MQRWDHICGTCGHTLNHVEAERVIAKPASDAIPAFAGTRNSIPNSLEEIEALRAALTKACATIQEWEDRNARQVEIIQDFSNRLAAARISHMCRDGHVEIWHSDSSSELCPLCRAEARAVQTEAALAQLQQYADTLEMESQYDQRMSQYWQIRTAKAEAERELMQAAWRTRTGEEW